MWRRGCQPFTDLDAELYLSELRRARRAALDAIERAPSPAIAERSEALRLAIDSTAEALTGDPRYFWLQVSVVVPEESS